MKAMKTAGAHGMLEYYLEVTKIGTTFDLMAKLELSSDRTRQQLGPDNSNFSKRLICWYSFVSTLNHVDVGSRDLRFED